MKVTRVPPGRPSRTTSGTRTTGWETLLYSNEQILNHSIFKTKKSIPRSCRSRPWHIGDRLECWPMSSQCLICKTLNFKQFSLSLALLNCTGFAHCACQTAVFLNGKYSNTTEISKIWPKSKKPRFSIKPPEPQIKQKKPRSSEKKQQWQHCCHCTENNYCISAPGYGVGGK